MHGKTKGKKAHQRWPTPSTSNFHFLSRVCSSSLNLNFYLSFLFCSINNNDKIMIVQKQKDKTHISNQNSNYHYSRNHKTRKEIPTTKTTKASRWWSSCNGPSTTMVQGCTLLPTSKAEGTISVSIQWHLDTNNLQMTGRAFSLHEVQGKQVQQVHVYYK